MKEWHFWFLFFCFLKSQNISPKGRCKQKRQRNLQQEFYNNLNANGTDCTAWCVLVCGNKTCPYLNTQINSNGKPNTELFETEAGFGALQCTNTSKYYPANGWDRLIVSSILFVNNRNVKRKLNQTDYRKFMMNVVHTNVLFTCCTLQLQSNMIIKRIQIPGNKQITNNRAINLNVFHFGWAFDAAHHGILNCGEMTLNRNGIPNDEIFYLIFFFCWVTNIIEFLIRDCGDA